MCVLASLYLDPLVPGGLGTFPPASAIAGVQVASTINTGHLNVTGWQGGMGVASGTPLQPPHLGQLPGVPVWSTAASVSSATTLPVWSAAAAMAATPGMVPTPPYTPQLGVCLSPGAEPFPPKLVQKVQSGTYIDMKEMLGDNIALLHQLEALNVSATLPALPGAMRPRFREVTSLVSWMYCYLAYTALRCQDPATRDRLAYGRLIIREAQRYGSSGWLEYFRQQAALDPHIQWNMLHPAIQASTLFPAAAAVPASSSQPPRGASAFCSLCRGVDHSAPHCALAYLHPPISSASSPAGPRPAPLKKRAVVAAHSICISWNRGRCVFPGRCEFNHICSLCFQQHQAVDCPSRSSSRPPPTPSSRPPPTSTAGGRAGC